MRLYSEIHIFSAVSGVLCSGLSRAASRSANDAEPLKKAKTPQGRFDTPEEKSKDVLQSENDDGLSITCVVCLTPS